MSNTRCSNCRRSPPEVSIPTDGRHDEAVCEECRRYPSVGPSYPSPRWPEFEQLETAVEQYLDHDAPDARWDNILRPLSVLLAARQRRWFVEGNGLSEPAQRACIARLIDGLAECPHDDGWRTDELHAPPHGPPGDDNATLWLDGEGEPALYEMHVHHEDMVHHGGDPSNDRWLDVFAFAHHHGLGATVLPHSYYHLGSAIHVVFYPLEEPR